MHIPGGSKYPHDMCPLCGHKHHEHWQWVQARPLHSDFRRVVFSLVLGSSVPGIIISPLLIFYFSSLMFYTEKAAFTDVLHSVFMGRCQSTQNHAIATVAVVFDNTLKGRHVFWHKFTGSIYNDCVTQKCSTRNYTTDTGSLVFYAPHFRISVRTFEWKIQVAPVLCLFALMPLDNLHNFLIYASLFLVQCPLAACTLEHCWECMKFWAWNEGGSQCIQCNLRQSVGVFICLNLSFFSFLSFFLSLGLIKWVRSVDLHLLLQPHPKKW